MANNDQPRGIVHKCRLSKHRRGGSGHKRAAGWCELVAELLEGSPSIKIEARVVRLPFDSGFISTYPSPIRPRSSSLLMTWQ